MVTTASTGTAKGTSSRQGAPPTIGKLTVEL